MEGFVTPSATPFVFCLDGVVFGFGLEVMRDLVVAPTDLSWAYWWRLRWTWDGCGDGGYEGYEMEEVWWRGADVEVLDLVLWVYG
jgi:hypothetical protein